MPKILVDKLMPGMKLSKPVKNESGMILLAEGTELSASLIERLAAMGVESVNIDAVEAPVKPKAVMLSELDSRFKKTESEPYMGLIKKIFKEHIDKLDG